MLATGVRSLAILVTVVSIVCLIAVSGPRVTTPALPVALSTAQSPGVPSATTGNSSPDHEYFLVRSQVVALGRRNITLPTLMYHYIRKPPSTRTDLLGYNLSVSPADFSAQMDWLTLHGYHPVDFNDVREYFAGRQALPAKPVIITLDDGYASLYTTAYPILAMHGFKAVAYIVSGFIGWPRYVTASQIIEMDRAGIEIAAHTVDHADLARMSGASLVHQLVDSKNALERLIGHPVVDFAYPSGKFNAEVVARVRTAGYWSAATEITSTDHSMADRYTWTRVRVSGGEKLAEFVKELGAAMPSTTTSTVDVESTYVPPPHLEMPTLAVIR